MEMKLDELLSLDFIKEFQSLLESDFEHQLFIVSLNNYAASENSLRFHNFAYSMRELVLYIINKKAPSDKVLKACWYSKELKCPESPKVY